MLLYNKQKRNQKLKTTNRFLVSINVLGSAGFHFSDQIPAFSYFTTRTMPLKHFSIRSMGPGNIGSTGSRNFVLSKKLETQNLEDSVMTTAIWRLKSWLNKSLGLMVPSH
ncbi:unnamed protein product [Arabidopsis halleri]